MLWIRIDDIPVGNVIMFIEQSMRVPFMMKIVHNDMILWISAHPDNFELVAEE